MSTYRNNGELMSPEQKEALLRLFDSSRNAKPADERDPAYVMGTREFDARMQEEMRKTIEFFKRVDAKRPGTFESGD